MSDRALRRTLIITVGAALVVTLLVAAVVVVFGASFAASGDTLTPLIAWGTWVTGIATVLLVVGAALAALRIGEQISQAERHHREQLAALLRPVLAMSEATWDGKQVRATIRNVGPGAAIQIRVAGSVVVVEETASLRDEELTAALNLADELATHDFVGRPGAIGPGDKEVAVPFHAERSSEIVIPKTAQAFFRWEAACIDGFREPHRTRGALLLDIPERSETSG